MNNEQLLTVSPSPHYRHHDTTQSIMLRVLLALTPALVWACIRLGMRSLIVTAVCVVASMLFEALYELIMHKEITVSDLSAAVTGVLIAYNVPVTIPLYVPIIGCFFAIVIVKQLFGGLGKNIVNPALAARVFMFLSWSSYMNPTNTKQTWLVRVDNIAEATPLGALKGGDLPAEKIFDLFIGNKTGVIGEISVALLLLGGLYLIATKTITWHIPVAYFATCAVLFFLIAPEGMQFTYLASELCAGGLALGAIFMATDYATSPVSPVGRIVYGIGCGLITVLIRKFGSYNEGVSFAILTMNLLVGYLDKWTRPIPFGTVKQKKSKQ